MLVEPDLTPLAIQRTEDHLRFVLKPHQGDIIPELPDDYEEVLAERLSDLLADSTALSVEIDLRGVSGISSRELGSLIALHKVLRPHFSNVPVKGVSSGVRHLLALTRTDQLFSIE